MIQKNIRKKPALGKIILAIFIFFIIFTFYILYKIFTAPEGVKEANIFTQIKHFITSPNKKLNGEGEDRINILLMGVGGGSHEGPYLTDTMMVVSIQPSTNSVGALSIPRDLYVSIPEVGNGKINTAYAIMYAQNPETAGEKTKTLVENIFNIPIHYYGRVDFDGFIKLIDGLGGITINVENTLDDSYYPIENTSGSGNGTYEHLVISKGIRYMNGETALKYVRSRKAKGVEGNDFARSKRQQKVMLAIKEKFLSPGTLLNFNTLNRIFGSLNEHIDTNLEIWEILRLYDLVKNIPQSNINHVVLDDGPLSPLYASTSTSAYLLKTRAGDWSDLQKIEENIFDQNIISNYTYKPMVEEKPKVENSAVVEKAVLTLDKQKKENIIEIDNGTKIVGLAKETSKYLTIQNYSIGTIGNAPLRTYKKTVIYNLKPALAQDKKEILKDLEIIFDAVIFDSGAPQDVVVTGGEKIRYPTDIKSDILIILGDNWREKLIEFQSNVE